MESLPQVTDSNFNAGSRRKRVIARAVIFLAAVLFIVLACVAYHKLLRYRLFPKRWGEVSPGLLYRSGRLHPALIEQTFSKHGIKTIINLVGPSEKELPEEKAAEKLGIRLHYFGMTGSGLAEDPDYYPRAIKIAFDSMREGKPVLVHCSAGSQRTGAFVAIYQTLVEGKDSEAIVEELFKYDFDGDSQLTDYLNRNMDFFARRLKELEVLEKVPEPIPQIRLE